MSLPNILVEDLVRMTIREDLGRAGDITTDAIVAPDAEISVILVARQAGVLAGLQLAREAFVQLCDTLHFAAHLTDGSRLSPGDVIAEISGSARAILTGERTALNFLIHLSGIASLTAQYVSAVSGTPASICCTRKTLPGLRAVQKYAVRMGGGKNHRFGLDDAVLIKDNHIAAAGGIGPAIEAARSGTGHLVKIEVEIDTLDQLEAALAFPIDAVLLDNMPIDTLSRAVAMAGPAIIKEASGGVDLATVRPIAETGVDLISVGALTHSAPALDIGLDYLD